MRKLKIILALATILYSCNEKESPDTLDPVSFIPIADVSGSYTTETTLIDISRISCNFFLSNVADGTLFLGFDKTMRKIQIGACGWEGGFGSYPAVEGPTPHILFSNGQDSIRISPSIPVKTFGFELLPNLKAPSEYQVNFYSERILIGSINRVVNTEDAKLFAATTNGSFDDILILAINPSNGFAIGQFRYKLP